jgi:hypothetical protein
MRFPYMGTARVKYVISMLEHRRLVRGLPRWTASPDFADTRAAGEPVGLPIETLQADDKPGILQTLGPWQDGVGAVQRRH